MKIIPRAEALKLGLTQYFNGKPCPQGHVAPRSTGSGECRKCAQNRDRERHQRDPERTKKRVKKWRLNNKDQYQGHARKWQKANPLQCAMIVARRRARKASAKGSHSAEEVQNLLKAQMNSCCGCGVSFDFVPFTQDHITPLFKGGTDFIENIQLMCQPCNDSKGTKPMGEWFPPWDINQFVIGA